MPSYAPASNVAARFRSRPGRLIPAGHRAALGDEVIDAEDDGRILVASDTGRTLVARDDGRIIMASRCSWAGRWCVKQGETRRLGIEFAELEELATETLTGIPTVTITGTGVVLSSVQIAGTQVTFLTDTSAVVVTGQFVEFTIEVTVATTGGATLVREGSLRVEI